MHLHLLPKSKKTVPPGSPSTSKYNREASGLSTRTSSTATSSLTSSCHFGSAGGIMIIDTTPKDTTCRKSTGGSMEHYRQENANSGGRRSLHFGAAQPPPKPNVEILDDKTKSNNEKNEPQSLSDYQEMSRLSHKTRPSMNFGSQMVM